MNAAMEDNTAMRMITVVLTKYSDTMSTVLYYLTGSGYTHASIALDEDSDKMYSFNFKGFCEETIDKHRRRGVKKSLIFHLQVTDAAHKRLRSLIRHFMDHRSEYSYTRLGVVMSFLRIPFERKGCYFCSQFVAQMLKEAGAVRLAKAPSLYLPNHFCRELSRCAQLRRIEYNPI